jgi:hypothetical protein
MRPDLSALDDTGVVAEDDRTHGVFLEVERKAKDVVPEVEQLRSHAVRETVHAGDPIPDLDHGADIDGLSSPLEALDLRLDDVGDL